MTINVIGVSDDPTPYPGPIIDVTTRSKEPWSKMLSPMYLGPVDMWGGHRSLNVENAWQFSKVYIQHTDSMGLPSRKWLEWATNGWADRWAHRYPMGKGAIPLYSWWDGKRLDYIEARKKIYIPLYRQAAERTQSWKTLRQILADYGDITLIDYDGYDYIGLGMIIDDVINEPNRKMGHAHVLALMLEQEQQP